MTPILPITPMPETTTLPAESATTLPAESATTLSGLGGNSETVRHIGYEWVRPKYYWESGDCRRTVVYGGAVAIQTNCGWLLLAKVQQVCDGPNRGAVRRVRVSPDELATLDC